MHPGPRVLLRRDPGLNHVRPKGAETFTEWKFPGTEQPAPQGRNIRYPPVRYPSTAALANRLSGTSHRMATATKIASEIH
jgi:hypothetical protein